MVDAKFVARARHFVPLSLLRHLADLPSADLPEVVSYVGEDGINTIKGIVPWQSQLHRWRVPETDISKLCLSSLAVVSVCKGCLRSVGTSSI